MLSGPLPKNTPSQLTIATFPSMLTEQDIKLIEQMIDQRIQSIIPQSTSKPAQTSQAKGYHTAEAIRELIRQHIAEFREWVGDRPFSLEVLRCFLKGKTSLLPNDDDILLSDKNCIRFDRQVANAVEKWRDSPFRQIITITKSGPRKFYYEIKQW